MDTTACILWQGGVSPKGYPPVWNGRTRYRLVFELCFGPIPMGMQIDHICHSQDDSCNGGPLCLHRRCLNPQHMELVTAAENIQRSWRVRSNHCKRGHEFTQENTYVSSTGRRSCRKCQAERMAQRRAAKKAAAA